MAGRSRFRDGYSVPTMTWAVKASRITIRTRKNKGSGTLNPADGSYLNEFRMHEGVDISYTKISAILMRIHATWYIRPRTSSRSDGPIPVNGST